MAHVTYTADASDVLKKGRMMLEMFANLQKQVTEFKMRARLEKGALTSLRTDVQRGAAIISRTVTASIKLQISNQAEVVRRLKAAFAASIAVKLQPYVTNAAIKTVKDRIKNAVGSSTAEIGLRFQQGAAGKFRDTLKRLLAVLSRGSYIDAELRLKNAQKQLSALQSKKLLLDVEVATGTAAKVKALLALLKSLRDGAKIPIRLDMDAGTRLVLQQLATELKRAADSAARLNGRLGGAASGAGSLARGGRDVVSWWSRATSVFAGFASSQLVLSAIRRTFAALKDALVDFPSQIQAVQVGFERMFGSKERAEGLMHSLEEFAVSTPFETQDLAPLATQALAFKLVDKKDLDAPKQIISLIKDIGDAAFGLGKGQQGVNQLMAAFGQIKVGTKVSGREMLRFQRVGVNAFEYLSAATGKSTKEVRELISKGLLPADKAIAAIRAGLRRDFGGGMEKAAKTMLGATSNIKDALRIRLKQTFAPQFEEATKFVVKLADTISSEDFGKKLDTVAGVAQSAIERIGEAWRILADLYTHNSGIINAALLSVGASLLLLNAYARGGPIGAFLSLTSAMNVLSQRTDGVGKAAKVLQPVLYGLAAAYVAVKVAAAQAAIAQGFAAAASGNAAAMTGLAAGAARLATMFNSLKGLAGSFKILSGMMGGGFMGGLKAIIPLLANVAAGISTVALVALPVLVAAIGVAAIGWQTYQENAARVDAANADLDNSIGRVKDAFDSLRQVGVVVPGAQDRVEKLREQYDKLGDSLEGLQRFKAGDLALARRNITFDTKLKPLEKAVLLDELGRIQDEIDGQIQAAQFKVQVEAEANPLSLANLVKAFTRTYGDLFDTWQRLYVDPVTTGLGRLVSFWQGAWNKITGIVQWGSTRIQQLSASLKGTILGSFLDGEIAQFRAWAETIVGIVSHVRRKIDWYMGRTGNAGETDANAPELPPSMTHAQIAEQKRKNAAWRVARGQGFSAGSGGLSASSDPYGDPSNTKDKRTFAQRVAANPSAFTPEQRRQALVPTTPKSESFPTFTPDPANPKKTRGKTDAEKAADAERRRQLREEKDQLADSAKSWDERAKAIEDNAKRQVEALTQTRDAFRDVFGSMQEEFVRLGIINDPLGPMIRSFERLIDLGGKSAKVVGDARKKYNDAIGKANAARSQQEKLSGLDGVIPSDSRSGRLVGGGSIGDQIAQNAVAMQRKWGDRIGKVFYRSCDMLADATVNGATNAFKRIMGPRSGDTAARTMARFQRAGIGFKPNGTYAPGDIVYSGARYGRGAGHVQVIGPDGRFYDQYKAHAKPTTPPQWVVRADGANSARAGKFTSVGDFPGGTGKAFTSKAFDTAAIDGVLSKVSAVPATWGKAVKSTETTTARFALQTRLATKEFQEQIEEAARQSGKSVPEIIAWLRRLGNEADARINRARSVDAVTESLRDLARQKRDLARDGNPLAGVMGEFEKGGKFEFAPDKRIAVYDAQMALATAQSAKATKEAVRAETMRIGVLKAAAPYLTAATAGTSAYEQALERANRKFAYWNDAQVRGHLMAAETFDKMGGAALKSAKAVREAAKALRDSGLDFGGASVAMDERATQLETTGKGLKGRGAGIRTKLSQGQKDQEKATREANDAQSAANRIQLGLEADFGAKQDIYLAEAERRILANEKLTARQKQIDLARLKWVHDKDLELRKNKDFLVNGFPDIGATRAEAERQAGNIDFASQYKTDDVNAYTASVDELAKAQATFGDMTGLAAQKFDLAHDALSTLTDAQKAQILVNAAATAGLQKYASEYDALFSQGSSLAEENLTRQIALTRGLSAAEQQELKWKIEDAQQRARLVGLSKEERDAYDAQRTKILETRDSIRELLAMQQRLATAEWFKNQRRSFQVLAEPNELKRARAELEQELFDQGVTDPVVIKIMLDTNDLLLRLQRTQEHIRDYVQGVSEVFGHAFDEAYEKGPGHFISATLDGFADMIQGVARQLITAQLTKLFVKAFPSLAGVYDQASTRAEDMNQATLQTAGVSSIAAAAVAELTRRIKEYSEAAGNVPSIDGIAGGLGGGGLFGGLLNLATGFFGGGGKGSAAPATGPISSGLASGGRGLFRDVSATNALHSNLSQSVLARRDAEMFSAISSNTSGAGRQVATVGGGDTNLNIANLNLPRVREGRDFVPELHKEVGPRLSRRSKQNLAWDGVSAGKRQR